MKKTTTAKRTISAKETSEDQGKERRPGKDRSAIADQVIGSSTIMRQVLPDFARIAVMVQDGVKGTMHLDSEDQAEELADLVGELTGFFAKQADGKKLEFELYWDEFIAKQNASKSDIIAYLRAAIDYSEKRLIVAEKKLARLRAEVEKIEQHNCLVLARKGEQFPIGGKVHSVPENYLGVSVFWEGSSKETAVKKLMAQFHMK